MPLTAEGRERGMRDEHAAPNGLQKPGRAAVACECAWKNASNANRVCQGAVWIRAAASLPAQPMTEKSMTPTHQCQRE
jgi:hypothetical protein